MKVFTRLVGHVVGVCVGGRDNQELEKKVSQTTPFKNLKKIMISKNNQLKELRARIAKSAAFFLSLLKGSGVSWLHFAVQVKKIVQCHPGLTYHLNF